MIFNVHPNSKTINIIEEKYLNLVKKYKISSTRNSLSKRPKEIVDYIFMNKEVTLNNFRVSKELVSDHSALIMEFD